MVDREFASYIPVLGVGGLNTAGFAGYSTNTLATGTSSDNIRITATPAALIADTVINTLNISYGGANTTVNLGGKTLTLQGGGLILGSNTDTRTATISNGSLTSGTLNVGGDLYVNFLPYGGTARLGVISANVTDNGSGAVRLILSSSEAATK